MKLEFYLAKIKRQCPRKSFLKNSNIKNSTLWKIQRGSDMKLTTAYKIVKTSNGEVTLDDLYQGIKEKD